MREHVFVFVIFLPLIFLLLFCVTFMRDYIFSAEPEDLAMFILRRLLPLVLLSSLVASPCSAGDAIDPSKAVAEAGTDTLWYDLTLLDIEGRGWTETKSFYDRLPAKAEGVVRDAVWGLSRNSSGLCARFRTDATAIQARWTLTSASLAMAHMPATG